MTSLMTRTCSDTHLARPPKISLLIMFTRTHALWRSRRALAQLSEAQLKDVDISRAQASHEANRPVWDVPANWRE